MDKHQLAVMLKYEDKVFFLFLSFDWVVMEAE